MRASLLAVSSREDHGVVACVTCCPISDFGQARVSETDTGGNRKSEFSVGSAMQPVRLSVAGSRTPIVPPWQPSSGIEAFAPARTRVRLCALEQRSLRQSTTATGALESFNTSTDS
ncbi:MAG: hypothetical protein JWN55_449 [Frankiales bacterium]|jgi:hypothetical protein|nr:hypothetical protein [Frankiales bacterium]